MAVEWNVGWRYGKAVEVWSFAESSVAISRCRGTAVEAWRE